jgi:hypothetical protein
MVCWNDTTNSHVGIEKASDTEPGSLSRDRESPGATHTSGSDICVCCAVFDDVRLVFSYLGAWHWRAWNA